MNTTYVRDRIGHIRYIQIEYVLESRKREKSMSAEVLHKFLHILVPKF